VKIGIFFGGPAREREISYAGGKTAYENIDKKLFTPVLVFIDSLGNFILVNESALYHAQGIRSFYPGKIAANEGFEVYIESLKNKLTEAELEVLIASVGIKILPQDFKKYFDFAFIIVHGPDCEDGAIQGLLEWYKIPYLGPGLMGSAVSIDKILQNEQIARANGQQKKMAVIDWQTWSESKPATVFEAMKSDLGLPIVVKAPHQGSSIGVAIVKENSAEAFEKAMNQCFFAQTISLDDWHTLDDSEKHDFLQKMANLDEGIGFPVFVEQTSQTLNHPSDLLAYLNDNPDNLQTIKAVSVHAEDRVLLEEFVVGQEFSCGVIQDDNGRVIALPPTEIIKLDENQTFDFKTKYKLATTRKQIPVDTSLANNQNIQRHIALVFEKLGMNVVARIDGFLTADGQVLLHDPNTLPGMSPTSLIFKQLGELGFSITQAITYLIRQSIRERIRTGKNTVALRLLLKNLDQKLSERHAQHLPQQEIIFEATDEQYAEARRAFGKFSAAADRVPVLVVHFPNGDMFQLPVNLVFKDTIDDLQIAMNTTKHQLIKETIAKAQSVISHITGGFDEKIRKIID
jgi:D-alanine-D-alanine ligase